MKMFKRLACALLAAAMAWSLGALAEPEEAVFVPDYPVNPFFEEAQLTAYEPVTSEPGTAPDGRRAASGEAMKITLRSRTGAFYTEDTTWTINITGGSGSYEYRFYVAEVRGTGLTDLDPNGYRDWGDSNVYSYRFVVPGRYALLVYVRDSEGKTASGAFQLTVPADGHPTTAQLVSQVAAQCLAAGCKSDYEKALWLHDYLTMNARYDYTYSYYSADGVLARGTGVCDSYSKAYEMLLNEVGIECERLTGGGHAWNAAKLDGVWTQIDPTWDDPNNSSGPVSGYEQHLYFGLPDSVMQIDHSYTPRHACTGYDNNYFIRSGKVSMWTDGLKADVIKGLDDGVYRYSVGIPAKYKIEKSGYVSQGKEHIVYNVSAYALSQADDWSYDGDALQMDVTYDTALKRLPVCLRFDGRTLDLTWETTGVGRNTFKGNGSFQAVILGDDVRSVGAGAFADCGALWKVVIPNGVTDIDPTAFEGCRHLTLVGPAGGAAQRYAQANGLNWLAE